MQVTDAHLPSEASIELPKVHVSAEYVQDGNNPREAQFAGMRNSVVIYLRTYKLDEVDWFGCLVSFWEVCRFIFEAHMGQVYPTVDVFIVVVYAWYVIL